MRAVTVTERAVLAQSVPTAAVGTPMTLMLSRSPGSRAPAPVVHATASQAEPGPCSVPAWQHGAERRACMR